MREPNSIGIVIESARRESDKGIFQEFQQNYNMT